MHGHSYLHEMCIRDRAYLSTGFPTRQITQETFISREAGSGTRLETENFLKEMGVNPKDIRISVEVRSTETVSYTHLDVYKRQGQTRR